MIKVDSAVGTVMDSAVYAISNDFCKDYYLIDIGDFEAAKSLLPVEASVRGVFITHGHLDHIFGLNSLKEAFPECIVYVSKGSASMLRSARLNLSHYLEPSFEYEGEVHLIDDGDKVMLFETVELTAVGTPGHNPSCMCFLVGDYLFTGDSYIPGVKVVTNLPGGNKRDAQESVAKILEMGKGKTICPGHRAG